MYKLLYLDSILSDKYIGNNGRLIENNQFSKLDIHLNSPQCRSYKYYHKVYKHLQIKYSRQLDNSLNNNYQFHLIAIQYYYLYHKISMIFQKVLGKLDMMNGNHYSYCSICFDIALKHKRKCIVYSIS